MDSETITDIAKLGEFSHLYRYALLSTILKRVVDNFLFIPYNVNQKV